MAQPVHFRAKVVAIRRHDADVATYRLVSERRLPRFVPGQFIHLTLDDYDPSGFWPESRVFSVANAVTDRRTVELTISRQGAYTSRILDDLGEGDTVWCKGPYGDFSVGDAAPCAVLIAGGTGITPFCAFMDKALSEGSAPVDSVRLHYGARKPELLLYRDLADRCASALPGFEVRYSAEEGGGDDVARGRLDLDAIVSECGDCADAAFYLSGPHAMIRAFEDALLARHGVARDRVLIDAWE